MHGPVYIKHFDTRLTQRTLLNPVFPAALSVVNDMQRTCDVTLRRVRVTIVVVEKQYIFWVFVA